MSDLPHQIARDGRAAGRWRLPVAAALPVLFLTAATASAQKLIPSHERARPVVEGDGVAARVNGVAIRKADVQAALDVRLPLTSYHQNVSPEKLAAIRQEALDKLIDEELRYQEAVRLNVRVTANQVEAALERARRGYKGGPAAFDRARRESGATMPQLRSSISRGLMINKVYALAVGKACRVTEADASAYYRDNRQRFVVPEQWRPSMIVVGVDPSASPQEWERARRDAERLAQRIATGESFDALARQYSTDPSKAKGGDLGLVHRGRLMEELETALAVMKPGDVSRVIQTIYGFHIMRLVDVRPPAQKSFAEVKDQLVRDLTETRCAEAEARWSKRLRAAARITS